MQGPRGAAARRRRRTHPGHRAATLAAAILCLALASAGVAGTASGETREDEIRGLDAREAAAMRAADVTGLGRIWSREFVVNAPDGRVKSRGEVLSAVSDGRIRYAAFDRVLERIVFHGDCAISMGGEIVIPTGDRPDAGQKIARRYSHVWQRSDGAWVLIARHASVAPKPE